MSPFEDYDRDSPEMQYLETRMTELRSEANEAFQELERLGGPALDPKTLTIDNVRIMLQAVAHCVSSYGHPDLAREYLAVLERQLTAMARLGDLVKAGADRETIDAVQAASDEINEQWERRQAAVNAYLKTME
jgi:hypothetical protein